MATPYEKYLQLLANTKSGASSLNTSFAQPSNSNNNSFIAQPPKQEQKSGFQIQPKVPQQQANSNNPGSNRNNQLNQSNNPSGQHQGNQPQQQQQNNPRFIPQSLESNIPATDKPRNYVKEFVNQSKSQDLFKQRNISPTTKREQEKNIQKSLESNFKSTSFNNFDQIQNSDGRRSKSKSGAKEFDTSQLFRKNAVSSYNPFKKGNGWGGGNRAYSGGSGKSRKSNGGQKLIFIELVGPNTIALKFENFYDPDIKDKIKALPDARYDAQSREWFVRKDMYDRVLEEIGQLCITRGIQIADIPEFAYELAKNSIPFTVGNKKLKSLGLNYEPEVRLKLKVESLPPKILENLYEFQKKGIEFGFSRFGRLLLGDEMGVGKTIQAIGISYGYKQDWPLFIVAPSSLRYTWKDEIMKWIPTIKEKDIQMFKKGTDQWSPDACIFIMSYDLAQKRHEEIDAKKFKICIADEAHYLKSRDSKRSKHLMPILTKAKRVILISGTPMLSRPYEIYNLMKILRPDIVGSFTEYSARYCNPKETPYGMDYTGNSCTKELHYILSQSVMIRRLKKEVLDQLPPKRRQKIQVQTDAKLVTQVKKILNNLKNDEGDVEKFVQTLITDNTSFSEYLSGQRANNKEQDDNSFMSAYRLTGESKIDGITDFMDTLIQNSCKFIVFAHHQVVMDGIEEFVKKTKVGYIRIDGKTNVDHRHDRVTKFQNDDDTKIAILSITACSQGLTLTAASTIVFAEMFWTPSIMTQAEDRAHRISQQNCVNIYYLHGPDTVDEMLFQMLAEKSQVVSDALDGKISEYHIKKAEMDQCVEEVKELKSKGTLNPVIIRKISPAQPATKNKIEDFFKKQKDLNSFVKKPSKRRNAANNQSFDEDIEDSDQEESKNDKSRDINQSDDESEEKYDGVQSLNNNKKQGNQIQAKTAINSQLSSSGVKTKNSQSMNNSQQIEQKFGLSNNRRIRKDILSSSNAEESIDVQELGNSTRVVVGNDSSDVISIHLSDLGISQEDEIINKSEHDKSNQDLASDLKDIDEKSEKKEIKVEKQSKKRKLSKISKTVKDKKKQVDDEADDNEEQEEEEKEELKVEEKKPAIKKKAAPRTKKTETNKRRKLNPQDDE
eukprot:403362793